MSGSQGVEVRHQRRCASRSGGRCNCSPGYRATVWDRRTKRKISRSFTTITAAKQWRADAGVDVRRGKVAAPKSPTLEVAALDWLAKARAGTVRNRSGHKYKPSTLRLYEQALNDYVIPALGEYKLSELRAEDVQRMIDDLLEGDRELSPSTIRNALIPLRAICRRALRRRVIVANPTEGLELPAVTSRRDRVATPKEAAALIDALPEVDRPIWATFFYAGPRLGEAQALRQCDIDLEKRVLRIRRTWDRVAGPVDPKSAAGTRSIPIAKVLEPFLHEIAGPSAALAFGRKADVPFSASGTVDRAHRIWTRLGYDLITPHECRHTFASLMIAAGVNLKALQVFMGHSTITTTLDLYGHLMPGSEDEAGELLDAYIAAATTGGEVVGKSNPVSSPLEQV